MKKIFLAVFLMMFIGSTYAELKVGFVQINKILKQAPQTAVSNTKQKQTS